jgi:hypothetical protein
MESTEHDGDVEDYSEGEGESTEPEQRDRVMYYPPAEETGRLVVRKHYYENLKWIVRKRHCKTSF